MHRETWLFPDQHVNEAWDVALLSLKINTVDCTGRERGSRWARGVGRVTRMNPGRSASPTFTCGCTAAWIYPAVGALVLIARCKGSIVELVWVTQKSPEEEQHLGLAPVGDWGADFNFFSARLDAHASRRDSARDGPSSGCSTAYTLSPDSELLEPKFGAFRARIQRVG